MRLMGTLTSALILAGIVMSVMGIAYSYPQLQMMQQQMMKPAVPSFGG
jgi:hypothetical protein